MRRWFRIVSVAGLIAGVPVAAIAQEDDEGPALSAADQTALSTMNASIVDRHVTPAFKAQAAAATVFAAKADLFCKAPDDAGLDALRTFYGALSDGWQGVQHLRFGPTELFMRSSRLMFWPDPRDSVGRQLADLLGKKDPSLFATDKLQGQSVSVQGLPALERLLFGDDARKLLAGDDEAALRCAAILGIAGNIRAIADGAAADWSGGGVAYDRAIKHAGPENELYRTPSEATVELFKSLHLAVEVVADRKLARALGDKPEAARPRLLEQWRSGRSLRNIQIDLAAAAGLWRAGMSDLVRQRDAALAAEVDAALDKAVRDAAAIIAPLDTAIADPVRRPAVEAVVADALAAKTLIANRLAPALGIPLGFNALDGD